MHGILKKYLGQTLSEHKSGIANISYVNDDDIAQIVNITKSLDLKGKKGSNSPKKKKFKEEQVKKDGINPKIYFTLKVFKSLQKNTQRTTKKLENFAKLHKSIHTK